MHVLFSLLLIEWAINYKTIITTLSFILRPVSATRLMKFLITFLVAYACINMIGLSYKFMNPGGDIVVLVDLCNCPPIWRLHTKTNHQKIILISYPLYDEYMLILCSRCSHYLSAKRNPLNTKSCSLPGWGKWAATGSKRRKRDRGRWQDNANFSWLKCLETPRQLPLFALIPDHLKNPAIKRLGIPGVALCQKEHN